MLTISAPSFALDSGFVASRRQQAMCLRGNPACGQHILGAEPRRGRGRSIGT